jgi:hypothetical protein
MSHLIRIAFFIKARRCQLFRCSKFEGQPHAKIKGAMHVVDKDVATSPSPFM